MQELYNKVSILEWVYERQAPSLYGQINLGFWGNERDPSYELGELSIVEEKHFYTRNVALLS